MLFFRDYLYFLQLNWELRCLCASREMLRTAMASGKVLSFFLCGFWGATPSPGGCSPAPPAVWAEVGWCLLCQNELFWHIQMEIAQDYGSPVCFVVFFFLTCFEFFILIWDEQMSKQRFGVFICSCLSVSPCGAALVCSWCHPLSWAVV